ncbi:MAG: lysophospholipid acyltransferase family protein [Spirochaetia bacterium]
MIYFIRILAFGALSLPLIFVALTIQAIFRPFFRQQIRIMSNYTLGLLARYLFFASCTKVRVHGKEKIPKEGCIFMANHQSSLDIMLIYGYVGRPMAMIAKKALAHVFLVGSWMKGLGCYLIDTKDPGQAKSLFEKAVHVLKTQDYPVLIYPEGTRSRKAEMGPIRPGSMRLPLMANCPIVPITISGSWKLMYGKKLLLPKTVDLVIGTPISTKDYTKDDQIKLVQEVERALKAGFTAENKEYYLQKP